MSDHAVWKRIRLLADRAGVPAFRPHDLRAKLATDLLESGADINAVRILLGHSLLATTARYDRRGQHAARKASRLARVPYTPPTRGT